jgi:hypothetical protein
MRLGSTTQAIGQSRRYDAITGELQKMARKLGRAIGGAVAFAAMSWGSAANAFEFELGGVTFGVQGFVRHELAVSLSDECNYNNQAQDCFIGDAKPNTFLGGGATTTRGQSTQSSSGVAPGIAVNEWDEDHGALNLFAFRGNLEMDAKISQKFQGFVRARFFSEPDVGYGSYEGYQPNGSDRGEFSSTVFDDDPNFYEQDIFGGKAQRLEFSGDNWMLDIPAAYIDFYDGPLWIRVGQQQIA